MPIHRHESVVVLRHDEAIRIHAERAYTVIEGSGEIHQLRLIADVRDRLEDFGRRLHADADVDRIRLGREADPLRFSGEPLRAVTPRCGHEVLAAIRLAARNDALHHAIAHKDRIHRTL